MDFGFIAADENVVFTAAALVMLALAAVEVIGLLIAASPFGFLDDLLPDAESEGGLGKGLAWLNAGRLPALAFLIVLLALFAVIGYGLQLLTLSSTGSLANGWLLALPAALGAAFATRRLSRWLAPRLPRDESAAVGLDELVGRVAEVTIGPVSREESGRATLRDQHGNLHNLRILAAKQGERFAVGDRVLLAARDGAVFLVTSVPASLLGAATSGTEGPQS